MRKEGTGAKANSANEDELRKGLHTNCTKWHELEEEGIALPARRRYRNLANANHTENSPRGWD